MMGHPQLRPGGAVSRRTAAQERYSLCYIAILDLDPAAIDRSLRTPVSETLLGRHPDRLVRPLIQGRILAEKRKQPGADRQARSQRRRMSQPPSLGDCCVGLCQCLVGKAKTEKDDP